MIVLCLSIFSWEYLAQRSVWLSLLFWLFVGVLIHLTSIRSAWLGYYILSAYPTLKYWLKASPSKQWRRYFTLGGILILITGLSIILTNPVVHDKFEYMRYELSQETTEVTHLSDQARIQAAKLAVQFIQKHPFGVGLGDFKSAFSEYTQSTAYTFKKDFLPHSQSLILGLIGGWPLLILSVIAFVSPLIYAIRTRNTLLGCLALFFFMLLNVEPLLDTQAGLIPFILFLSLADKLKLA